MPVEPPFGDFTDPNDYRNVDGIPIWIVEQVNSEIRRYYENHPGDPVISGADEHYFLMDEPLSPSEFPPIYQLPKSYCVYILKCERQGFDDLSSLDHAQRVLQERADRFGYDYSTEWMAAAYYGGPPRYVGLSTNPYARIHEHTMISSHIAHHEHQSLPGNPPGARFTAMFPPSAIQRIEWVDDKQTAEQLEQETANRLNREEGYFVHPPPTD